MEMTSKMQILIMYAKSYEIKEDGKDTMRGVTVNYFFYGSKGEQMKPMRSLKSDEAIGYQRGKVSLDYEMRSKIPCAPGIYEGDFIMSIGADGKPVLKLVDVTFLKPFKFSEFEETTGAKK